jgi:hypothetical protein
VLGSLYLETNKLDKAYTCLIRVTELYPDDVEALADLAALFERSDFAQALASTLHSFIRSFIRSFVHSLIVFIHSYILNCVSLIHNLGGLCYDLHISFLVTLTLTRLTQSHFSISENCDFNG